MSLWFLPLFIARALARKNRWLLLEGVRVRRLYLFSAGPFHWLLEVDRGVKLTDAQRAKLRPTLQARPRKTG